MLIMPLRAPADQDNVNVTTEPTSSTMWLLRQTKHPQHLNEIWAFYYSNIEQDTCPDAKPVPRLANTRVDTIHHSNIKMALSNVQFFMCTNQKAKLTMIFSCYRERPRIWQIFPSVQEKRIEQIPGAEIRNWLVVVLKNAPPWLSKKSFICLMLLFIKIIITSFIQQFFQVSKSAAEYLAAMRIMCSTLPLQPKLQRHLTVGAMTTITRPTWMGSTQMMNLCTSSLPSGSWISWLHFS